MGMALGQLFVVSGQLSDDDPTQSVGSNRPRWRVGLVWVWGLMDIDRFGESVTEV